MSHNKIWVIDDDRAMRWVLEKTFKEEGFDVHQFWRSTICFRSTSKQCPRCHSHWYSYAWWFNWQPLGKVKGYPDLPVIIMTAHSDLESAVSSYQNRCFEYLQGSLILMKHLRWWIVRFCISTNCNNRSAKVTDFNPNYWWILQCRKYSVRLVAYRNRILRYSLMVSLVQVKNLCQPYIATRHVAAIYCIKYGRHSQRSDWNWII